MDGIATMQIQNLNALVDTVRHEIIERYRPGEDKFHSFQYYSHQSYYIVILQGLDLRF